MACAVVRPQAKPAADVLHHECSRPHSVFEIIGEARLQAESRGLARRRPLHGVGQDPVHPRSIRGKISADHHHVTGAKVPAHDHRVAPAERLQHFGGIGDVVQPEIVGGERHRHTVGQRMFKRTGDIANETGSGLAERQQTAVDQKGVLVSKVRTGDHDPAASHKVTDYVCPRRAERRHLSRRRVQLREDQEDILAEQLSLQ